MSLLFVNARKVDVDGVVERFWMRVDGDTIVETGTSDASTARVGAGVAAEAHRASALSSSAPLSAGAEVVDLRGGTLVPGFIDLHGHGGGGASVDDGPDAIQTVLATHRAHGTTRSVLSLVAAPLAELRASLEVIAELSRRDPLVLGAHAEGPFLAASRRGAHAEMFLRDPNPDAIDELLQAGGGVLRQVTIAPERPGALAAIAQLVGAGVRAAVGHTDASAELARDAFDAGASILTHAFNAMPGIHHRAPGPVIAAMDDERVTLELVLDGLHVVPPVARLAFTGAPGRVALVTDSMAAAGSHDGDYQLGALAVTVRDGLATLRGTDTIAGSTLTQDRALRNAVEVVGVSLVDAVAALTAVPAKALGLDVSAAGSPKLGRLAAGYAADAVHLSPGLEVVSVWGAGRRLG